MGSSPFRGAAMPYALSLRQRLTRPMPSACDVFVMFQSCARSSPRMYARSNASRASRRLWSPASAGTATASRDRNGVGRSSGVMTSPGVMMTSRSTMLRSSRTLPGQS